MKAELIDISPVKKNLAIEVSPDEVSGVLTKIVSSFQRQAKVPGFRPGRAPLEVVRTRFKDEILSEMMQQVLPSMFADAVKEKNLDVVGNPHFDDIHYHSGEPLTFKAVFEIYPALNITNYVGIPMEQVEASVGDDQVDAEVRRLQEQTSELIPVEEERPITAGDFAEISYEGVVLNSDEPPVSSKAEFEVGSSRTLREFTENLTGARVGESREFEVAYPAEYPGKTFAGKTVLYKIKVEAIKLKKVPELNDEFAQSVGEYETVDDMRAKIRHHLEVHQRQRQREQQEVKLLDWLQEQNPFELPDLLVDSQTQVRLERMLTNLMQRGVDPQKLGWDWTKLRAEEREQAARDVRGSLILEHIADQEKIEVSEYEIDAELTRLSEATRQPLGKVKEYYSDGAAGSRLRGRLRNEKTFTFLLERAEWTKPSAIAAP